MTQTCLANKDTGGWINGYILWRYAWHVHVALGDMIAWDVVGIQARGVA